MLNVVSYYEYALRNGGAIPWICKIDIRWRLKVELQVPITVSSLLKHPGPLLIKKEAMWVP